MPAILAELVFLPLRRRQRSGLPHTVRGLPARNAGQGEGAEPAGWGAPGPLATLRGAFLGQPAAEQGRRRMTHLLLFPWGAGTHTGTVSRVVH